MLLNTFEIKVALLGNVSAGKTTVLNALFGDKYGEVSMKRTTAGVHYFRVVQKASDSAKDQSIETETEPSTEKQEGWFPDEGDPQSPADTLNEISQDNAKLRGLSSTYSTVQEKWFDIELDKPLCEMRKDTRLVIVDIPGINEAGASNKYRDYVNSKWETFDCVILVMDGKQGVNTEDQTYLLEILQQNLNSSKDIPIMIVCNKIDDPDDSELDQVVQEARNAVEERFPQKKPTFIPASALYGFIFQSASKMSLEEFKAKLATDLMEKLGKDQLGRLRWNKLSEEQKWQEAHNLVSDLDVQKEALEVSNFGEVVATLNRFVGGEDVQRRLIEKQIEVSLKSLEDRNRLNSMWASGKKIADCIRSVNAKAPLLYGQGCNETFPVEPLQNAFWKAYTICEDSAIWCLTNQNYHNLKKLERPVKELLVFYTFSVEVGWSLGDAILGRMIALVRRLIGVFLEKERQFDCTMWMARQDNHYLWKQDNETNRYLWSCLSPLDWINIWGALLSMSYDEVFCSLFATEKRMLEGLYSDAHDLWRRYTNPDRGVAQGPTGSHELRGLCPYCGHLYVLHNGRETCGFCRRLFLPEGHSNPWRHSSPWSSLPGNPPEGNSPYVVVPKPDFQEWSALKYDDATGTLVPVDSEKYRKIRRIFFPESFADPGHIAYTAFQTCEFAAWLEKSRNNV